MIRLLRHLDHSAEVGDGLVLGVQLLCSFELADDLLRRMPGAFHGEIPRPVWPDGDSHSPRTTSEIHDKELITNQDRKLQEVRKIHLQVNPGLGVGAKPYSCHVDHSASDLEQNW